MSFGMIMWNQNTEKKQLYILHRSDGFIAYTKTECIYIDIAEDNQTRLGTSNYELKENFTLIYKIWLLLKNCNFL